MYHCRGAEHVILLESRPLNTISVEVTIIKISVVGSWEFKNSIGKSTEYSSDL